MSFLYFSLLGPSVVAAPLHTEGAEGGASASAGLTLPPAGSVTTEVVNTLARGGADGTLASQPELTLPGTILFRVLALSPFF